MKRLLLVLTMAAVMLALTASPALAQAEPNENNCYGAGQSGNVAGEGGLPGSKTKPAPGFEDPRFPGEGVPTWNGPVTSFFAQQPPEALEAFDIPVTDTELEDNPNAISAFQELNRASASCGTKGKP
jgi:hypothetical protein